MSKKKWDKKHGMEKSKVVNHDSDEVAKDQAIERAKDLPGPRVKLIPADGSISLNEKRIKGLPNHVNELQRSLNRCTPDAQNHVIAAVIKAFHKTPILSCPPIFLTGQKRSWLLYPTSEGKLTQYPYHPTATKQEALEHHAAYVKRGNYAGNADPKAERDACNPDFWEKVRAARRDRVQKEKAILAEIRNSRVMNAARSNQNEIVSNHQASATTVGQSARQAAINRVAIIVNQHNQQRANRRAGRARDRRGARFGFFHDGAHAAALGGMIADIIINKMEEKNDKIKAEHLFREGEEMFHFALNERSINTKGMIQVLNEALDLFAEAKGLCQDVRGDIDEQTKNIQSLIGNLTISINRRERAQLLYETALLDYQSARHFDGQDAIDILQSVYANSMAAFRLNPDISQTLPMYARERIKSIIDEESEQEISHKVTLQSIIEKHITNRNNTSFSEIGTIMWKGNNGNHVLYASPSGPRLFKHNQEIIEMRGAKAVEFAERHGMH